MTMHPENHKLSRLDPEPVTRRDFLGMAALASAAAAALFALIGALRLPRAAVLPSPSKKFKISLPESLAPGEPFVPANRPVAVFRDSDGVYAVSTVCTHLGCIVKQSPTGFDCPCHGSRFSPDGSVLRGPAPKPLDWLEVESLGDGKFIIDEGMPVAPGTKERA